MVPLRDSHDGRGYRALVPQEVDSAGYYHDPYYHKQQVSYMNATYALMTDPAARPSPVSYTTHYLREYDLDQSRDY
jgi:hypothetical protein